MHTEPDVYKYTDYRKYLRDWCDAHKKHTKGFTYRGMSRRLGFKSPGHLSMILRAQANLTDNAAHTVARVCKLTTRRRDYFLHMVRFNQARTHEEKTTFFNRLASYKQSAIHLVHASQYAFYDRWYHAAIRVLVEFFPFRDEYSALADMLIPSITPGQAKKSIALLQQLNLIYRDAQGYYHPVDSLITSGWDIDSFAVTNYVIASTRLAVEAPTRFPKEARNCSTLTIGLSPHGFARVVSHIREFRKRILEIAREEQAQTVYQLGIQLFPLSKTYAPHSSQDSAS